VVECAALEMRYGGNLIGSSNLPLSAHMKAKNEREEILREIIVNNALEFTGEPEDLDLDSRLTEDLKMDELDQVEIVMNLRKCLIIDEDISEETMDSFKTIRDILNYLEKVDAKPRPFKSKSRD
jgi:acyl carrier protein